MVNRRDLRANGIFGASWVLQDLMGIQSFDSG